MKLHFCTLNDAHFLESTPKRLPPPFFFFFFFWAHSKWPLFSMKSYTECPYFCSPGVGTCTSFSYLSAPPPGLSPVCLLSLLTLSESAKGLVNVKHRALKEAYQPKGMASQKVFKFLFPTVLLSQMSAFKILIGPLAFPQKKKRTSSPFWGSEICNQMQESIQILPVEFCKNPWILALSFYDTLKYLRESIFVENLCQNEFVDSCPNFWPCF